MIYIVRAGDTDMIKIGFAVDVAARITFLQTGCWERLSVIREMEGDRSVECWFHRHFKAQRVRGEWFRFHPDMLTAEPVFDAPDPKQEKANQEALLHPTYSYLIGLVDEFLVAHGMSATAFGIKAVNDGKFVGRLRSGRNMTLTTMHKVRDFILANSQSLAA